MDTKAVRTGVVAAVGLLIWFCPVPDGVTVQAWRMFAIFAASIAGLLLRPMPMGVVALTALTIAALTNVLKAGEILSGFANPIIWLIVCAFLFARGFVKTGLGRRIAFLLSRSMGSSSLKLGYSLMLTNLLIAPATPSNAARLGGIIYPILRSLASAFGSEPDKDPRRLGAYIIYSSYTCDTVISATFLTALGANVTVYGIAMSTVPNFAWSWMDWFISASVPCLAILATLPWVVYKLYPPTLKYTPEIKEIANKELKAMGPMSYGEKAVAIIFVCCLILWASTTITKLNATVIALLGVVSMFWSGALTIEDFIAEKSAWDTLVWMGSFLCMAGFMGKFGLMTWFAQAISAPMSTTSWHWALVLMILAYMYSQYFFASATAHGMAMFAPFVVVLIAAGAPLHMAIIPFFGVTGICGGLTYYSMAPGVILYGSGYVEHKEWFRLGFIISTYNLAVWMVVGSIWWKFLGYW
jgi:anion transporter